MSSPCQTSLTGLLITAEMSPADGRRGVGDSKEGLNSAQHLARTLALGQQHPLALQPIAGHQLVTWSRLHQSQLTCSCPWRVLTTLLLSAASTVATITIITTSTTELLRVTMMITTLGHAPSLRCHSVPTAHVLTIPTTLCNPL